MRPSDLARIGRLAMVCDDCGRRRVWGEAEIARAQLRWRVRSVVQLGTRLTCKQCVERGQGGHNISIYADEIAGALQADADRKIADAETVTSSCSDCGYTIRFDREALCAMPAVETFGQMWKLAFCPPCRAAGARKANVVLVAEWMTPSPRAPRHPAPVAWSMKEVFGEERDDPDPALPRSRLMRCA